MIYESDYIEELLRIGTFQALSGSSDLTSGRTKLKT